MVVKGKAQLLNRRLYSHPGTMVILGFAAADILGALLLWLPCMHTHGMSFVDAAFTSTSAVCVTGLNVVNVARAFTISGQFVILLLMQIGGLGVMTFSVLLFYSLGQPVRLSHRIAIQENFLAQGVHDLKRLIKLVFIFTMTVEAISGLSLSLIFMGTMPPATALFNGFFHAVSSFCNAGFSTFQDGLLPFRENWPVCLVIMLTILLGNTGFSVVYELIERLRSRKKGRFSLHFRLTVTTHLILVAVGTAGILFFERHGVLASLPFSTKFLVALFHSISARTAGFNTVDMSRFTEDSLYLILLLMFIGACPGSTGGGLRTTTFAVLLCSAWSRLKGHPKTTVARRSISEPVVQRAMVLFILSVSTVILAHTILMMVGPNIPFYETRSQFLAYLFETISGLGTVGLSVGITTNLDTLGKLVVIFIMFIGRVGLLSVLSVLMGVTARPRPYYYVEEDVMVG